MANTIAIESPQDSTTEGQGIPQSVAATKTRRPWLAFCAIAAASLAMRFMWLGDPAPGYDEQLYHLVGVKMLGGQMPYVDLWDRKPFLLFVIYAFAAAIGGGAPLAYQLLATAFAAVGGMQVYCIARRFGDAFASLMAALIYLIAFPLFDAPSGQSEVFYIPLLLAMLQLTIASQERETVAESFRLALGTMALGGLALQIKYTVLPHCVLFGIVALWQLHRLGEPTAKLLRHASVFALVGLVPTLATTSAYALAGQFDAFFYANFSSIFARGELTGPSAEAAHRWILYGSSWLWLMASIGLLLVAFGIRRCRKGYYLALGYVVASLVAMVMVGNIYIHYFIPVASGLALLAVPAFSAGPVNRLLALIAIGLAVPFTHFDALLERARFDRASIPAITQALHPYVGKRQDCLFVYDGPLALYLTTESCLPTRFIFPDHLNSALEANAIGIDAASEVRRILAARPGAIVARSLVSLPRPNQSTAMIVKQALARDYTRVPVDVKPQVLDIYVRNDLLRKSAKP